jgi:hypothetical protein
MQIAKLDVAALREISTAAALPSASDLDELSDVAYMRDLEQQGGGLAVTDSASGQPREPPLPFISQRLDAISQVGAQVK